MFCPACGANVPEGSHFCTGCGANLAGGEAGAAAAASAAAVPAVASELEYYIRGTLHQVTEVHLAQGQRMFSETGAMIWMNPAIELDTAAPTRARACSARSAGRWAGRLPARACS